MYFARLRSLIMRELVYSRMDARECGKLGNRNRGRTPPGTPTIAERRRAARAAGAKTFDPGVPCIHGHMCNRRTDNGICVQCTRDRGNAYNAAHKEEHRARSRESASRRPDEIKAYRKRYYREHSDEAKRRSKEWVNNNRERERAARRRIRERDPERIRSYKRKYATKNRDILNAKNREGRVLFPERWREWQRRWKRKNPEKLHEQDVRRRALQAKATVGPRSSLRSFFLYVRSAPRIKCYWCGLPTKPKGRHIDHVIPLAKGGAHVVANLCVSCPDCNLKKNAKMPEEFAGQAELALS